MWKNTYQLKPGDPPLGRAEVWAWDTQNNVVVNNSEIDHKTVFPLELNTMPGWAGKLLVFNRYMDAHNTEEFASKEALDYWQQVDLYIGGSEHATGTFIIRQILAEIYV
jgi:leucyl-tRNA synthetase